MKVDFFSNMSVYQKRDHSSAGRDPRTARGNSTDVADFSRGGASPLDRSLMGIKASIQSAVGSQASPARLEALSQSIRDGSYHVSTDTLVRAFLSLDA